MALTVGGSKKLTATVTPEGKAVTWKSSDDKVATVKPDGTVEAVSEGTADVTANVENKEATCKVTVTDPEATE